MKGKAKNKRKIGKVILIGLGFFLTIVLTFTTTLAWFYDSDWASKSITMAGTVGIEIRDGTTDAEGNPITTTGEGQLHFNITTEKAYPGQSIDVSASCYNNGGNSGSGGSKCYVRAHFAVYTNIGKAPDPADYAVGEYSSDGTQNPAYQEALAIANNETDLSAEALYAFLEQLISEQNSAGAGYYWAYYQNTGAVALSKSGISESDTNYYVDGKQYKDATHDSENSTAEQVTDVAAIKDKGYFYLCTNSTDKKLLPLSYGESAVFLWNSRFIIPWKLTNASADKHIFVALQFQAVQTFIPKMSATKPGVIDPSADNQLPEDDCLYDKIEVQTVFSSSNFGEISTTIGGIDFSNGDYDVASKPSA